MEYIKVWGDAPSDKQLDEIVSRLERGEIGIIPTDSVYAIVCDALSPKAIDRICALKGIDPDKNTLSVICHDLSMAAEYASYDDEGFRLLKEHTPAPVTFIFRAARTLPKAFKGRREVGIRIPDLQTPRDIVARLGHPILSTTVGLDDPDYAREPGLLNEKYDGRVDFIVDGGEGDTQTTTIVDARDGVEVIREGKYEF